MWACKNYDVWLGNNRGSKYSLGHKELTHTQRDYWLFSFQQMGQFDTPAQIKFALTKSGSKQLSYMGLS